MSYRFEIAAGKSKRFPVGGKYCENDIVVTAVGGSDAPSAPDEPATPEYSEGLLIEWDEWGGNYYVVNGRGSCTDSVVVIPETYNDGVHGRACVEKLGKTTIYNPDTWMEETVYVFGWDDAALVEIYLPSTRDHAFNSNSLRECPNLKKIYGVSNPSSFEVMNLPSLEYVEFRKGTSFIGGYFGNGTSGVVYDFSKCTTVPSLDSYSDEYCIGEFGSNPIIKVPKYLLERWKQATNWVQYADYIVEAE